MKKRIMMILWGTCLLLLAGCMLQPKEKTVTVSLPDGAAAVFDGELTEEGVGEGRLDFNGWVYEGSFRADALLVGRTEDRPCALVMGGTEMSGRYTGPLKNGEPSGEGVFRADNGAVYAGEIRGMSPVKGEVTDMPCGLTRDGNRYEGVYQGTLENGAPNGLGFFEGKNEVGYLLSWMGDWAAGAPGEEGRLCCDRLLTRMDGREIAGVYEGEAREGVPEGRGIFRSVDGEGVSFTYEGGWHKGVMEGEGTLRYEAETRYVRAGYFTGGSYTPTWLQALTAYGTCEPLFTLSEAQMMFLEDHPEFWEKSEHLDFMDTPYKDEFDKKLTVNACFEDPSVMEEPRWMCQYSLRVINAVSGPIFDGGPVMTRIMTTDGSYNKSILLLVPGAAEGLYRGQRVHAYALPLAMSSYTTVLAVEKPLLILLVGELYNGR